MWEDIDAFYSKYKFVKMAVPTPLGRLPDRQGIERLRHLKEELSELALAVVTDDVARQADAIADLVYVALGTAWMMGLPFTTVWSMVHLANMQKVLVDTPKRVGKPDGWQDPIADIERLIATARKAA